MLHVEEFYDEFDDAYDGLVARLKKRSKTPEAVLRAAVERAYHDRKVSMFGKPHMPVSPHIRAAVVCKHAQNCFSSIIVVTKHGLLLSGVVQFACSHEVTNKATLYQAEEWAKTLDAGETHGFTGQAVIPISNLNHFSARATADAMLLADSCHKGFKDVFKTSKASLSSKVESHVFILLRAHARKRLGACRKTLLQALDSDVLRIMHQCLDGGVHFLSRLTGADEMAWHPDWERRKAEALKVAHQYPAFVTIMGDAQSELRKSVDAYGSMMSGLMHDTGLSESQLRALRPKSYRTLMFAMNADLRRHGKTPWSDYALYPAEVLRSCPPKILLSVLYAKDLFGRPHITQETQKILADHAKEVMNTPDLRKDFSHGAAHGMWNGASEQPSMTVVPGHLRDTTRFLREEVVKALASASHAPNLMGLEDVMMDVLSPRTMSQLISASQHHHSDAFSLNKFRDALLTKDVSWTGLTCGIESPKGTCRELTSKSDLALQGEKQKHCVGGYDYVVLRKNGKNQTLIFSVENDKEIIGTAEVCFSIKDDELTADVRQFRSVRNSNPSDEAHKVLNDFLAVCKKTLKPEALEAYAQGLPPLLNGRVMMKPDDIMTGLMTVWPMIVPLFNKAARKMSPSEISQVAIQKISKGAGALIHRPASRASGKSLSFDFGD